MGFHSYRGEFLKGYDRYAKAVTLTYNRSGSYRTAAGGLCTMFAFTLLFYWLCVNIYFAMANYGSFSKSVSYGLTIQSDDTYPLYEINNREFIVSYDIYDITGGTISNLFINKYVEGFWA